MDREEKKLARQALREERREIIGPAYRRSREHMEIIKRLGVLLTGGSLTVPELSKAAELPTPCVLWHVIAMKKYGMVNEVEKDGDYFRYALAADDQQGKSQDHA